MRKILIAVTMLTAVATSASAQTQAEIKAKQIGIIIAAGNYAIPEIMEKVQQEGSGAVIAERCGQEFTKNENLKQICIESAQTQDLQLYINMTQAQKGK